MSAKIAERSTVDLTPPDRPSSTGCASEDKEPLSPIKGFESKHHFKAKQTERRNVPSSASSSTAVSSVELPGRTLSVRDPDIAQMLADVLYAGLRIIINNYHHHGGKKKAARVFRARQPGPERDGTVCSA